MTQLEEQVLAQTMTDVYEKMEYDLMMNVVKNIRNYDQITPTGQWQLQKLAEVGKLNRQNIRIMADELSGTGTYFEDLITKASMQTLSEIEPGYRMAVRDGILGKTGDAKKSPNVKAAMKKYGDQAKEAMNLVNTAMLTNTKKMYVKLVNETAALAEEIGKNQEVLNILNKSAAQVISGAESRQQALRKTIKEFNAQGITAYVDKAGRNWTPEAYTNMVLRSTVSNVSNGTQLARMDDYDIDYLETSSHPGARPKCAKDQGKIFCRSGRDKQYPAWSSSSYGEPDGMLGINCGHSTYPHIPGVSIQRYFPQPDAAENDKQYKLIQGQRALERDIRKQKRELAMFDILGDKEAFQESAIWLKQKEAGLSHYCGQHNLPRRKNREQVDGFGKSQSAKAVTAVNSSKKQYADKHINSVPNLNIGNNSSIINAKKFDNRSDADKLLRPETEKLWTKLTSIEKESAFKYTEGSGSFNRLLRGYDKSWSDFIGVGKVPLNNEGAETNISALKSAIDKSYIQQDIWLFRGSDKQSLAGLLSLDKSKIQKANVSALNKKFSGTVIKDEAFFSTGVSSDAGFQDAIAYEILAPKGTRGIYAEPFSRFGLTNDNGTWDGVQASGAVGMEAEVILQKGTAFEVVEIKEVSEKITVVLKVLK